MAQVINTNVMSLNAQRNLNSSGTSLATSIQRLSSGMRINSAKDDAAGLAISERFTTQIRGLDVATRNANDGISLAQTAEGAMVEISNNLQRIRELAVQSANATNSASDRKALQAEVTQLTAEIDRVARQTNFNGTTLLDGSFSGALFQVGADAGQTIGINAITNARADKLGGAMFTSGTIAVANPAATGSGSANGHAATTIAAGTITIAGVALDAIDVPASAQTYATAADAQAAGKLAVGNALAAAINAKTGDNGLTATVSATGDVSLASWKEGAVGATITQTGLAAGVGALTSTALTAANAKFAKDLDISSFAGSQQALQIVDKALTAVSSARADMGAIQNRFASTIANLSTTSENLSASRSRIRDTDYAKETAELTRTQILQQAGTAMLSQANSSTSNVLSLLQ
ncbi:flagellin [Stenotrophomonas ginsengisoli]|uniref:Flagellin n=1 Tax=Stenotrophomonas ginsengisoli TaxID=336566 RepID=A0A0R0DB62_9GAMM|nr:flagellin [Stenotrophomonas ginsengisoli]KRG78918.1 flagellin [Stenotrophomonas ginsengisoli]